MRFSTCATLAGLVISAAGCGPSAGTQTMSTPEAVAKSNAPTAPSEAARLGVQGMPGMPASPAMGGAAVTSSEPFSYNAPIDWNKIQPTDQRNPNFVIPGTPGTTQAECYVTVLAGSGGGIGPNINRWRGQMGLPAIGDAEIAALPKLTVLGGQATLVDLKGSFKGMSGSAATTATATAAKAEGQDELLGCIADVGGNAIFVKMTGPTASVSAQADNFKVFLGSLKTQAVAFAGGAAGGMDTGSMPQDATHAGLLPGAAAAMGGATSGASKYAWTAPAGWKDAGPAMMRDANYRAGANGEVECYVSLAGGGVDANINRWRGQMGQPALSPEDLAKLPKLKILGADSPMVAIEGTYQGMSGAPISGAEMLGAICPVGEQQMFFKMTGPKSAVEAERQHFIDFCQSTKASQ